MLVAAVTTPLLGKLGDQYGKERLLLISLLVFFVGCVLAVFAWNIWSLIGARAIQGVGGVVFPLTFAIVKDEFPAEKFGTAIGITSSTFAVGGGLGLVLSGLVIDHVSWRWLFVLGAVAVGVSAALVHRFVPESPIKTPSRVDVPGAVLLSAGLVTLLLAISEGSSWGWTSATTVGLFVSSAASFGLWVLVETRVPEPLIDMHVFTERPVLLTNIPAVLPGFSMFGAFVLVPNLLQLSPDVAPYGLGVSSTATGLYLLPSAVTGIFAGPAASVIARRYGAKVPLSLGLTVGATGIAMIAVWHSEPWQIGVGFLITGSGVPMAFAAMASLIVQSVRPSETGVAGGINTVMRTVGGVVGGQAGAAILAADTIGRSNVPAESAFTAAFAAAAAAALIGSLIALWVTPMRRARAVPVYER